MIHWCRLAAAWTAVLVPTAAATVGGSLLGVPSPALFAALAVGFAWALLSRCRLDVPGPVSRAAQAAIGVAVGATVQAPALIALGTEWAPVLLVSVATIALSVGTGLAFARHPDVDAPTGAFAMVAGGASGIVAISRGLGADERLVALVQYLRVLVIVLLTPVLAHLLFASGNDPGPGSGDAATTTVALLPGLAFTAACMAIGLLAARLTRLPAGSLLGPMIVAAAASLLRGPLDLPAPALGVPPVVQDVAFIVIGLQVGLRFTVASLRSAGRVLPRALVLVIVLLVACAGLGLLLVPLAGVSALDGYLATTPGGLYVVLATAAATGSDTTFVLGVQVMRLFAMLLVAPLLARWLVGRAGHA